MTVSHPHPTVMLEIPEGGSFSSSALVLFQPGTMIEWGNNW